MVFSFALRRTISLAFIFVFLVGIWQTSTHQNGGMQYVQSVLDSIHSHYPAAWPGSPTPFPRGSDPTRGYWATSTDHKHDSRLWDLGECYDRTSELKNGKPIPGGFIDDGSRAETVESWEWVMEDGRGLREWDMDGFLARALQSRVGVFIAGDSINNQIYTSLLHMLNMPEPSKRIFLRETYGYGPVSHTTDLQLHYRNLTLNPDQETYRRLRLREDLAHIPEERWKQPVVRFFRCDMLVLFSELEEIVTASGANTTKEQLKIVQRTLSDWRGALRMYQHEPGWKGEKPGLVLISTGPHWELGRLKPITESEMVFCYNSMSKLILKSTLSLGDTGVPLNVLMRSIVPGHEHCENYRDPVPPTDSIALDPTGERKLTWGWHLFPDFNAIAKADFSHQKQGSVRIEYWDVWEMGATRPDAHIAWQGSFFDCLHWCPTSIPQRLIHMWYHTILEENW